MYFQDDAHAVAHYLAGDAANPKAFAMFKRFAFQRRDAMLARNLSPRGSAQQIIERMRWETTLTVGDGASDFKINDHYAQLWARLLVEQYPAEFGSFFKFRSSRFDSVVMATTAALEAHTQQAGQ